MPLVFLLITLSEKLQNCIKKRPNIHLAFPIYHMDGLASTFIFCFLFCVYFCYISFYFQYFNTIMKKFFLFSRVTPLLFHTIHGKFKIKGDIHNIFVNIRTIKVLYRSRTGKFFEFYIQLCVQKPVHIRPDFTTQGRRTSVCQLP